MFDTSWDVEKYKTDHESDEHWELRRKFMVAHQSTLPEDEVVCMAQVFTNIEFLGCRYPDETMVKVASLAQGVVEDFREKKKNTLKRTFVAASDAATSKVKGLHRRSDASDQSSPAKKQIVNFLPSSENQNSFQTHQTKFSDSSSSNSQPKRLGDLPGPFGKYVLFYAPGTQQSAHSTMCRFISGNKAEYKCEVDPLSSGQLKCTVSIDGHKVGEASALTAKEAKDMAVSAALDNLRQQCYTLVVKSNTVGQNVNQSDLDPTVNTGEQGQEKQTESNNIGGKLMKMMGWTGGGLGKDAQGIVEPILAATTVKRHGLGGSGKSSGQDFNVAVRKLLREWIQSGAERDLLFSTDFSKEDRKVVHNIASKLGVKSKSFGKGEQRRLVLSRKQRFIDIVEDLLQCRGNAEKYDLLEPGAPLPDC